MAVSSVKGCVSVGQEGNSYSQNAELRWDHRSIKQGMKYQVLCSMQDEEMLLFFVVFTCFDNLLVFSREVCEECTVCRLISAWTECLLLRVLHTHS